VNETGTSGAISVATRRTVPASAVGSSTVRITTLSVAPL
jgi:hypothetical protein